MSREELVLMTKDEIINKYLENHQHSTIISNRLQEVTNKKDKYFDIIKAIINQQENNIPLVCECCGSTKNVSLCFSPYAEEIYDILIPEIICDECLYEECMDI